MEKIEKIFCDCHRGLCAVSQAILLEKEDSLEVVSEAFQEVLAAKKQHLPQTELKNYLFMVVRNRSLNRLRKRRNFHKIKDYLGNFFFPLESERVEGEIDFRVLLQKLPVKYREVLFLRINDDYKNHEIAEILGIPIGTVKSRLNYALKILRKEMEEK